MVQEQNKLASEGIQLVELRLDFLRREPDFSRLLSSRPGAAIVTARRKQDGGMWNESESKRLSTLRSAIVAQPEFIDLELDVAREIERFGSTKRIISYHDFTQTPNLDKLYNDMESNDPDIIKIATTPQTVDDMFRLMKFVKEKNQLAKESGDKLSGKGNGIRVIGICMGEIGKATRILAKRFGMPFTYATFSRERIIAPGILVYDELLNLYHYESTNNETATFGIIANPIGHSLSPLIHNKSYVGQNINAVYVPFQIESANDVRHFIDHAEEFGICGLSVTIPHKVTVVEKLTKMEPAVDKIGACNTIVFKNKERLGYNTDYTAAVSSIETAMGGDIKNELGILQGKSALILGAGGAGMALAYGLKKRGAVVTVTDANNEKAVELSIQIGCETVQWNDRYTINPEILVNCTPVGMHPNINESPFDKDKLFAGMIVFDAVYNPENTLLIKSAKEKGCKAVSGVEMFVGQACLQFKLFTGEKASATFIRKLVKDAIAAGI
jgi:3-dehydroquinate dehydratase/shikimate dehydrogenase